MAGCVHEWFERVSAWHDGEVSPVEAARVRAHLEACAACRRAGELLGRTSAALRAKQSSAPPPSLEARVRSLAPKPRLGMRWVAVAVAVATVAASAALPRRALAQDFADEVVAHHVRGFAREKPCDYESSDPDAVARWVASKLGYRVDVPLPAGATLLGARVCSIDGVKTAALMYRGASAPVTIFVPPRHSKPAETVASYAGADVRCTKAALATAICAADRAQPMVVVSEGDAQAIASAL